MNEKCRLEPSKILVLECNGKIVVDEELAKILYMVKVEESLHKASKLLGVPYSRLHERIRRAEEILGEKLVFRWRGGASRGGAKLTSMGEKVLEAYMRYYRLFLQRPFEEFLEIKSRRRLIVFVGSHDFVLENVFNSIQEYHIEPIWSGTVQGLIQLAYGGADLAGAHYPVKLGGPVKLLEALGLKGIIDLHPIFKRRQGFASRKTIGIDTLKRMLNKEELVLAVRNPGSGTRILMEELLSEWITDKNRIKTLLGKAVESRTHFDTCKHISSGKADIGLTIEPYARLFGLNFIPITWEDYVIAVRTRDSNNIRRIVDLLRIQSTQFIEESKIPGYEMLQ
ncbi:MAG: helix-turn-helix transcriptional regulator [Desulfurococcales archaeon]|nr:helix-turn-helix transcriptional regulator [Desulfurococcales archaeon]MEB3788390.1 helix-turn-helix transcriptional regulator [Desulfurococcales archaeon]